MAEEKGRLHIYLGDGKGKTTAAIGLAIRMLGHGGTVGLVQFDKGSEGEDLYCERRVLRSLPGLFLRPTGCSRIQAKTGSFRLGVTPEDRKEGEKGLAALREFIEKGEVKLLVADEICSGVASGIIDEGAVLALLDTWEERGRRMELVFTGRHPSEKILARADLASEIKKIKHYFDSGQKARPGIEY